MRISGRALYPWAVLATVLFCTVSAIAVADPSVTVEQNGGDLQRPTDTDPDTYKATLLKREIEEKRDELRKVELEIQAKEGVRDKLSSKAQEYRTDEQRAKVRAQHEKEKVPEYESKVEEERDLVGDLRKKELNAKNDVLTHKSKLRQATGQRNADQAAVMGQETTIERLRNGERELRDEADKLEKDAVSLRERGLREKAVAHQEREKQEQYGKEKTKVKGDMVGAKTEIDEAQAQVTTDKGHEGTAQAEVTKTRTLEREYEQNLGVAEEGLSRAKKAKEDISRDITASQAAEEKAKSLRDVNKEKQSTHKTQAEQLETQKTEAEQDEKTAGEEAITDKKTELAEEAQVSADQVKEREALEALDKSKTSLDREEMSSEKLTSDIAAVEPRIDQDKKKLEELKGAKGDEKSRVSKANLKITQGLQQEAALATEVKAVDKRVETATSKLSDATKKVVGDTTAIKKEEETMATAQPGEKRVSAFQTIQKEEMERDEARTEESEAKLAVNSAETARAGIQLRQKAAGEKIKEGEAIKSETETELSEENEEKARLESKIRADTEVKNSNKAELTSVKKEVDSLKGKIPPEKEALEDAKKKTSEDSMKLEAARVETQDAETRKQSAEMRVESLDGRIESEKTSELRARKEAGENALQVEREAKKAQDLGGSLDTAKATETSKATEVSDKKAQVLEASADARQAQGKLTLAQEQVTDDEAALSKAERTLTDFERKREQYGNQAMEAEVKADRAGKKSVQLEHRSDSTEKTAETSREGVEKTENEISDQVDKARRLEDAFHKSSTRVDFEQQGLDSDETSLKTIADSIKGKNSDIERTKDSIALTEREVLSAEHKARSMEKLGESAEDRLTNVQEELQVLDNQKQRLTNGLQEATSKYDAYRIASTSIDKQTIQTTTHGVCGRATSLAKGSICASKQQICMAFKNRCDCQAVIVRAARITNPKTAGKIWGYNAQITREQAEALYGSDFDKKCLPCQPVNGKCRCPKKNGCKSPSTPQRKNPGPTVTEQKNFVRHHVQKDETTDTKHGNAPCKILFLIDKSSSTGRNGIGQMINAFARALVSKKRVFAKYVYRTFTKKLGQEYTNLKDAARSLIGGGTNVYASLRKAQQYYPSFGIVVLTDECPPSGINNDRVVFVFFGVNCGGTNFHVKSLNGAKHTAGLVHKRLLGWAKTQKATGKCSPLHQLYYATDGTTQAKLAKCAGKYTKPEDVYNAVQKKSQTGTCGTVFAVGVASGTKPLAKHHNAQSELHYKRACTGKQLYKNQAVPLALIRNGGRDGDCKFQRTDYYCEYELCRRCKQFDNVAPAKC